MKIRPKLFYFLLGLIIAGMVACATPIAPTGGPADKTGPKVEFTSPETGTTNFDGRSFVFQFNEFIGRSSVQGAITVEPDLGIDYDVSWSRKTMTIEFEERFPDSTTVIIKLGTDLADTRGNKMERPVTLAISTGDEIDEGKIMGRIRMAEDGTGAGDRRVLLYRQPIDLSSKASYEAQTDTGGVFRFSYLAEGRYKALLVDDRNRNKIWDRGNESAYPFFQEFIDLEKADSDTLDVIYVTEVDSVAPTLQGVGLFSTNRMRLRFSENISIEDDFELVIEDSAGQNYTTAYPLYIPESEPFVAFAQSQEPLLEDEEYRLRLSGFTDKTGNPLKTEEMEFSGTSQEDTTRQRIISANGTNGLLQDEVFKVTYAAPITEPEVTDSLVVIEGQVDFENWPEVQTNRNELWISPQREWIEGVDYQFLVWNPKTLRRKLFEPEVWDSTEYGDIEINLQNVDSTDIYYVQLLSPGGEERGYTSFGQSTVLTGLPPLSYTLILFRDDNGNEKWDRGTVNPFNAPEHYYVQRNLKVQEGFTSEVNITFD
ncbi:Ig-like domain-containing protein [Gracilimonas sp. BCB1]|uniref:Ig-like domain-containing protein n=1 Tax=Gracilimonas sp. BCB1 TaxID=3152362 RepID=UPI0032D94658